MDEKTIDKKTIVELSVDDILPNRFQPRIKFDDSAIFELSESIKLHGVFQPIIVRPLGDKYEIIAGERRYKASVLAGKISIPAIVMNINDSDSVEIALIENVQRADLTPIEEAISYKKILDMGYISQEALAKKLGRSQSTIANKLRLLNLDEEVQEALMENKISERHARSLLKLKDNQDQRNLLEKIITNRLTVRKTDEEIDRMLNNDSTNPFDSVINVQTTDDSQGVNPFNSAISVGPAPTSTFAPADAAPTPFGMPDAPVYNIGDVNNQVFNPSSFDANVINSTVISSNQGATNITPDTVPMVDINNIEQNAQDFNVVKPAAPMPDLLAGNAAPAATPAPAPQDDLLRPGKFFNFPADEPAPAPAPVDNFNINSVNSNFVPVGNAPADNSFIPQNAFTQNSFNNMVEGEKPADDGKSPFDSFSFTPVARPADSTPAPMPAAAPAPVASSPAPVPGEVNKVVMATNLIKMAVDQIKELGIDVSINEMDNDQVYGIIINIKK